MLTLSLRAVAMLFALQLALGFGHVVAQPAGGSPTTNQSESPAVPGRPDGLEEGMREFGAWLSVSLNSATADVRDRDGGVRDQVSFGGSYILGLRYGKILAAGRKTVFEYALDLVPLALVTEIPKGGAYDEDRSAVYGLGFSPVGLQLYLLPSRELRLYAGGTAGFLIFTRDVPVQGARQFNFRFEAGVGLELAVASGWAVTLGIGLQHLSSASKTVPNPGLDHRMLSIGLSRFQGP